MLVVAVHVAVEVVDVEAVEVVEEEAEEVDIDCDKGYGLRSGYVPGFLLHQDMNQYQDMNQDMDDHQHLSALDVTQVAWTLKVRATRMWILSNDRGEAIRHNLILLDCKDQDMNQGLSVSGLESGCDYNLNSQLYSP
ncbi:hypothetical protein AgCh_008080 [Apium graveolens]